MVALYVCPDCKCSFVQPFRCVTCGAQKLYDNTVLSLERSVAFYKAETERLQAALNIIAGYEQCVDNTLDNAEIAHRALSKEGE